jgi:hypothetical protein
MIRVMLGHGSGFDEKRPVGILVFVVHKIRKSPIHIIAGEYF